MNPLVFLLRWSIKGMHEDVPEYLCSRVGLAILSYFGLAILFCFIFLDGRPHTTVWPTLCASSVYQQWCILAGIFPVYTPSGYTGKIPIGGAFDLRGCYGTSSYRLMILAKNQFYRNSALLPLKHQYFSTFFLEIKHDSQEMNSILQALLGVL